jgi:hypothetical protein
MGRASWKIQIARICFALGVLILLWVVLRREGARSVEQGVSVLPTVAASAVPTLRPTEVPTTELPTPTDLPTSTPDTPPIAGVAPLNKTDCPPDHPIKGNIPDRGERKGEHIYHLPGNAIYDRTNPERCFVSPEEAEAAGYRLAQ